MELENQQREKFCLAYVYKTNGNATKAAKLAGYSAKTARTSGSRLLTFVDIQGRIKELTLEAIRESGWDRDKVKDVLATRLFAIAQAEVTDVVNVSPGKNDPNRQEVLDSIAAMNGGQHLIDFGGALIAPTANLPSHVKTAIKSIKTKHTSKGTFLGFDVEMHDPIAAERELRQLLGIGDADSNVNVVIVADELEKARKRAERVRIGGAPAESVSDADKERAE